MPAGRCRSVGRGIRSLPRAETRGCPAARAVQGAPVPNVAVLTSTWLPSSQTFVRDHVLSLRRYTPVVLTWRVISADTVPNGRLYDYAARRKHWFRPPWTKGWRYFSAPCRKEQIALLHAHFAWSAPRAIPLAGALRIPLVVTCHGTDVFVAMRQDPLCRLRERLFEEAARIVVPSDAVRASLLDYGADARKIVRLNLGVDCSRFAPAPQDLTDTARDAPRFLCVARFVPVKGHRYLLPAFAEVLRTLPDARLVLVGDGELMEEVKQQAVASSIDHAVAFLGALSSAAVADELARADVVVLSSVTCADGSRESFPVATLEAQAAGKPVVGTRCGGLPEAVEDGKTGLLVDERDIPALAEAMLRLARDPALRRQLGVAGRQRVLAHFDLHKQTALMEALYDEVIAESLPQGRP